MSKDLILVPYSTMVVKRFGAVQVEITQGDIVNQQDIEAIVNAANAALKSGSGVAGAIHRAAGKLLEEECRPLAPILPGEAVITGGHQLPNRYVIHCLGPIYGIDHPSDILLADCYRNALLLADSKKIESIAFPSISTGAFGYPLEAATEIALNSIIHTLAELKWVRIIRMVLFSEHDYQVYIEKLKNLK